ncbi:MAG TPA: methyltransferase domain-containing protein [Chitinophagaceae bacterium]|nr:methyltransferase domain-containing protein [Chitinophagaceae bacterium]
MIDFAHRSYKKELLDSADIPFADIKRNMQELEIINRRLGGHKITLNGLKSLLKTVSVRQPFHIAEIGCGGGDNLKVVNEFCKKKKIKVHLTGIDINPECIEFARSKKENRGIDFITSDYRKIVLDKKPDIIFSSLFCHHFSDREIVELLHWMKKNSSAGFFINDLHRHYLAYHSIKWLTGFFSKSYLVKNDAPLSVQKGFRKKEWKNYLRQAGMSAYRIQWRWAFRWLITVKQ